MKKPFANINEFKYSVFKAEDIDAKFKNIISRCKDEEDHVKINKIVHEEFYNEMFLTMTLDKQYGKVNVYRVTKEYPNMVKSDPMSFAHKPDAISERNRANIKGASVFYGAFTVAGALREMKDDLECGKEFYVSEWEIDLSTPIYAHSILVNSSTTDKKSVLFEVASGQMQQAKTMFENIPDEYIIGWVQYIKRVGDLFALPGNNFYNITSAYAHKVLYDMRESGAVVSMLLYPSAIDERNLFNFAIHPDLVKSDQMYLKNVFKLKVDEIKEDGFTVKSNLRGKNIDGKIVWQRPSYTIKKVDYHKAIIHTFDNCVFSGTSALSMKINNTEHSVEEKLHEVIDMYLHQGITSIPFEGDIFSFETTERYHKLILECKHGWQIETGKGHGCIKRMIVPISWTEQYSDALL
jgi:hypothetical protein